MIIYIPVEFVDLKMRISHGEMMGNLLPFVFVLAVELNFDIKMDAQKQLKCTGKDG